eukprot:Nk52_evm23s222 gene=Nk52_evmTU23s222
MYYNRRDYDYDDGDDIFTWWLVTIIVIFGLTFIIFLVVFFILYKRRQRLRRELENSCVTPIPPMQSPYQPNSLGGGVVPQQQEMYSQQYSVPPPQVPQDFNMQQQQFAAQTSPYNAYNGMSGPQSDAPPMYYENQPLSSKNIA